MHSGVAKQLLYMEGLFGHSRVKGHLPLGLVARKHGANTKQATEMAPLSPRFHQAPLPMLRSRSRKTEAPGGPLGRPFYLDCSVCALK